MALRTEEELKQLFELSRLSQQKKKEKEKQRYKKAQESTKKELLKKKKKENKIQPIPTKTKKTNTFISIYNSPTIERETPENKLYSLFELQHIEELYPDEEGRICWTKWNELIQNFTEAKQ